MWYIAAISVLLIVSTVFGITKNRDRVNAKSGILNISTYSPSLTSLSRSEINLLLSRLENEEPPESVMGAMCYGPAMQPSSAEYVCPICSEKTLYGSSYASLIDRELSGGRRIVESINLNTDFEVSLDEELFCDFCSPDSTNQDPALLLRVEYQNGDEFVNRISISDLRMLESFVHGSLFYMTSNDSQRPLKDYADRMRTLLGFEEEI